MRGSAAPELTDKEFLAFSELIEREIGIKSPPEKRLLLQGRIGKRVVALGLGSFAEYFRRITGDGGDRGEYLRFIDLVTTHETSFFRESRHFSFLEDRAIPALMYDGRRGSLNALCAACSSGEEAYSVAMASSEALGAIGLDPSSVFVEGFDISPRMAEVATRAVYPQSRKHAIPRRLYREYCMESRNPERREFRIVPEMRALTRFHPGNLLANPRLLRKTYDVIFCRNVLIYFPVERQIVAIELLLDRLAPGGFLFLGHSESVTGLELPVRAVAPAVFQRSGR